MNPINPPVPLALARYSRWVLLCAFLLIIAGGLVTSTDSGLSVPDWPLSYGRLMPPMVGGIFYEHGHRMVATAVGILTIILALWIWRKEPRRWVRRLGWGALGLVILQGLLGGLTVWLLLPTTVSVAHASMAQIFFCCLATLALVLTRRWQLPLETIQDLESLPLRRLCAVTTAAVFVQLVLGAVMRHTGSGLAIPDFPLAFGGLIPDLVRPKIAIHFAHRVWGFVVFGMILWTSIRVVKRLRCDLGFLVPVLVLLSTVTLQISLGAATVWSRKGVFPTTAHVATGALILAASWLLTLQAWRFVEPVPGAKR